MAAVPTVRVGEVLIATLGDELEDTDALRMQETIGDRIISERVRGVLLDISALEIVDSFICKVLSDTAHVVRILGADVAVVGMRPVVAITLVELGLPLPGVPTALTIDRGMALLATASERGLREQRAPRA